MRYFVNLNLVLKLYEIMKHGKKMKTDQSINKHIGSNFDDYLKDEGIYEEWQAKALGNDVVNAQKEIESKTIGAELIESMSEALQIQRKRNSQKSKKNL